MVHKLFWERWDSTPLDQPSSHFVKSSLFTKKKKGGGGGGWAVEYPTRLAIKKKKQKTVSYHNFTNRGRGRTPLSFFSAFRGGFHTTSDIFSEQLLGLFCNKDTEARFFTLWSYWTSSTRCLGTTKPVKASVHSKGEACRLPASLLLTPWMVIIFTLYILAFGHGCFLFIHLLAAHETFLCSQGCGKKLKHISLCIGTYKTLGEESSPNLYSVSNI